jgi:hypothetical protein
MAARGGDAMLAGLPALDTLRYAAWAALILLSAATFLAVFLARRSIRLSALVAYSSSRPPEHGFRLRYGFIALSAFAGAVLALEIGAGEPPMLRGALTIVSAAVMGVAAAWFWLTVAHALERLAGERTRWERRLSACTSEFAGTAGAGGIRTALCEMLSRELGAAAVHLFDLTGRGFERIGGSGPAPSEEIVFPASSPMAESLEASRPGSAVRLADPLGAQAAIGLRSGETLSGFLLLGPRGGGDYDEHQLRFASELAARGALAAQMAAAFDSKMPLRLRERDDAQRVVSVRIARSALAPPETAAAPMADCAAGAWTGVEGNCYCDIINLSGAGLAIVSAQAAVGGEEGAVELLRLQTAFRSRLRLPGADLGEIVRSALMHSAQPELKIFAGILSPDGRIFTYLNADHPPPVVMHFEPSGTSAIRLTSAGPAEVALNAGDLLAVFSEGLANARNPAGEAWGERRLLDTLLAWERQPCEELVQLTLNTVLEFTGHTIAQPDRTLAVLKPIGQGPDTGSAESGEGMHLLK